MVDTEKKQHIDFTALAKQIESNIDPDFVKLMEYVEFLNKLFKCDILGNVELIPVGSCIDGSKVTMASDCGDMDVLIVSNQIILKEYLFDYDNAFPAFLHIRVSNEHQKFFKTVNDPIEGVYLPVAVLKELRKRSFMLSTVFIQYDSQGSLAGNGKFLNVTRPTSVGKEHMQLYPDEQNAFGVIDESEKLKNTLTCMSKLAKCALGNMMNQPKNTDTTDAENGSRTTDRGPKLTDHEYIPLLEMINEFLDMCEGKETNNDKTRNISDVNEDRMTDVAAVAAVAAAAADDDDDDYKDSAMKGENNNKEDNKTGRDMLLAESLLANGHKVKGQVCRITRAKQNTGSSDSKLNDISDDKNGMNLDPVEVKVSCITGECKMPNKNGAAKKGNTFSKLKSTYFVPAFRFEGWPRVADEWMTRSRKWPSQVTLKRVLEAGCQVVAKRPLALYSKSIAEERDPYFRLSFAVSEIILAQSMNERQLLCWRVLKAYQKCFLQTRPKCLSSYHWKNVLFWVNEDLDETFWTDENVPVAVLKCLDYMGVCLRKGNLPFYFVKKMNLLHGCDETLFDILREQIEAIRAEPLAFLKRFISEPPKAEKYSMDISEIENIQKANAQNFDSTSDAIFNGQFVHVPSSSKSGETDVQHIMEAATHLLKERRSKIEERSSHYSGDAQDSDSLLEKTFLDKFEKIIESVKNQDVVEASKALDGLCQTITNDEELNNENVTDSERALKQSFARVLSTFSSIVKGKQEGDNNLLHSLHQYALALQEDFESNDKTHDDGQESKKTHGIFSLLLGSFVKCVDGIQKCTKEEGVKSSPAYEIRKALHEAAQKIGAITAKKYTTGRKADMDIELD